MQNSIFTEEINLEEKYLLNMIFNDTNKYLENPC